VGVLLPGFHGSRAVNKTKRALRPCQPRYLAGGRKELEDAARRGAVADHGVRGEAATRFFTPEWWFGPGGGEGVPGLYAAHLESIRPSLPGGVLAFLAGARLHDATLVSARYDAGNSDLILRLYAYDALDDERPLELAYRAASAWRFGGGAPGPLGACGYDELDLDAGQVRHSLVFSSGAELSVLFRDMLHRFE
jgi:hypothetical protein